MTTYNIIIGERGNETGHVVATTKINNHADYQNLEKQARLACHRIYGFDGWSRLREVDSDNA